jgi:hypothetical protein
MTDAAHRIWRWQSGMENWRIGMDRSRWRRSRVAICRAPAQAL